MANLGISIAVAALIGVSAGARAQSGFFDFGKVPGLDTQPTVQVDLNGAMIGFVSDVAKESDPEAAEVLSGIRSVRVYAYENVASKEVAAVQRFIDETSRKLETEGWHRAVFVQDGDDKVRMYVKLGDPAGPTPSHFGGLTVMMTDGGGEAFFVNVDGQIDPAQLGRLAALGQHGRFGGLDRLEGFGNAAPTGQDDDDRE